MEKASRRVVAVSRKPGTIQAEFTDQNMKPFQLCPPTPLHSSVLITTTPDLVSMRPDATEWSKAKVCVCVCVQLIASWHLPRDHQETIFYLKAEYQHPCQITVTLLELRDTGKKLAL